MDRRHVTVVLTTALLALGAPALADTGPTNILVEFSVDWESGDPVRSYEVLVAAGSETEFDATTRVPMPTHSWKTTSKSGEKVPVVSFSFYNAGFKAALGAVIEDDGHIRVRGHVEDSRPVREEPVTHETPPAKVDTFRQEFDTLLADGEPVELLRYDDPLAGSVVLVIEARVTPGGLES